MNKLFSLIIAVFCFFLLFGCEFTNNSPAKQDEFKITLSENIVTWDLDEKASCYKVFVNELQVASTVKNVFTIVNYELEQDIYVLKITETYEVKSNTVTYHVGDYHDKDSVAIFQINDTHGAVLSDDNNVGIAKVASLLKTLEKKNDYIKIANGDIFQGTYVSNSTEGLIMIDALNLLDFDCFVIGNHEFDWGLETLRKYKDGDLTNGEAEFPFLGANIIDKTTGQRVDFLDDYCIVENNGYKVGIIGIIGSKLETSVSQARIAGYDFVDSKDIVKNLTKELKNEKGCDLVIVSEHDHDEYDIEAFANFDSSSDVDGIVCGHTHKKIEDEIKRSDGKYISIIQSNTKNISVGEMIIKLEDGEYASSSISHYYPQNEVDDLEMLALLEKYEEVTNLSSKVLTTLDRGYTRSALGVFACNEMAEITDCNVGVYNTAGVRNEIAPGDITYSHIYDCFPFDNQIYVISISSNDLKNLYNTSGEFLYFSDNLDDYLNLGNQMIKIAVIDYVFTSPYYDYCFDQVPFVDSGYSIRDTVLNGLCNTK